jgi:hypothetical protein
LSERIRTQRVIHRPLCYAIGTTVLGAGLAVSIIGAIHEIRYHREDNAVVYVDTGSPFAMMADGGKAIQRMADDKGEGVTCLTLGVPLGLAGFALAFTATSAVERKPENVSQLPVEPDE